MSRCADCGVQPGQPHKDACDVARCLWTGYQRLACNGGHDCGQDVWTGRWPGEADAIQLGWLCRWTDESFARTERCGPDDPCAMPDMNRLVSEGRWNRELARWEAP